MKSTKKKIYYIEKGRRKLFVKLIFQPVRCSTSNLLWIFFFRYVQHVFYYYYFHEKKQQQFFS